MRIPGLLLLLGVLVQAAAPSPPWAVTRIDFPASLGLTLNAAGPLLLKADPARGRLLVACTQTASLSVVDVTDGRVRNLALPGRMAHYLKGEAMAVSAASGRVYLAGPDALWVADPQTGSCQAFPLERQYESLAVDEASGNAFLAGRESARVAFVDVAARRVRYLPWGGSEERMANRNATPPPPLRKVVCEAGRVHAFAGDAATLTTWSARDGRRLASRRLPAAEADRWHLAGVSPSRRRLLLVAETGDRRVVQALSVDLAGSNDQAVALPALTEAVGVGYSEARDEIYVAYDNHPTLHVVVPGGSVSEVRLPSYGNDAVALDEAGGRLYVASWAWSEIDEIDLQTRRLVRRITQTGVLPHTFGMVFHPGSRRLYVALGATAVNGSFGSAVTEFDPQGGGRRKIALGWAPVELAGRPGRDSFLAFNAEDAMAEVQPDGRVDFTTLPVPYPRTAVADHRGNLYLAYGAHQSYWPTVYIWGARNGVLTLRGADLAMDDRRLPRLAQRLACSGDGALWATQNNWGEEKPFLAMLPDDVRSPNLPDLRLELDDRVARETTQRLLALDEKRGWLYHARTGETDDDRGLLHVIDAAKRATLQRVATGLSPADLAFDEEFVYVANFDSGSVSRIRKDDFRCQEIPVGLQPLKLALAGGAVWVLNHGEPVLRELGGRAWKIPARGRPDNLAAVDGRLWVTVHDRDRLTVLTFDPASGTFATVLEERYPYGDTSFAAANAAFFMRGQFGDGLYDIGKIRGDGRGRIWISDFLSGRLFIVAPR